MTILDFFAFAGVLVGKREFYKTMTISLELLLDIESIEGLLAGVLLPGYPIINIGCPPESSMKLPCPRLK
jgi:hypothetical protein